MELVSGLPEIGLEQTTAHGTIVFNLSKAIAGYLQDPATPTTGYACCDLGLILARNPDTVRIPSVCFFETGEMFAESDKLVTDAKPEWIVEVATLPRHEKIIALRIDEYFDFGVNHIWVINTQNHIVEIHQPDDNLLRFNASEEIVGPDPLPGFSVPVSDLFREPDWWTR